jgi:hypothetical protein
VVLCVVGPDNNTLTIMGLDSLFLVRLSGLPDEHSCWGAVKALFR